MDGIRCCAGVQGFTTRAPPPTSSAVRLHHQTRSRRVLQVVFDVGTSLAWGDGLVPNPGRLFVCVCVCVCGSGWLAATVYTDGPGGEALRARGCLHGCRDMCLHIYTTTGRESCGSGHHEESGDIQVRCSTGGNPCGYLPCLVPPRVQPKTRQLYLGTCPFFAFSPLRHYFLDEALEHGGFGIEDRRPRGPDHSWHRVSSRTRGMTDAMTYCCGSAQQT